MNFNTPNITNNNINFSNPTEVTTEEFTDILNLDFVKPETVETKEVKEEEKKPVETTPTTKTEVETKTEEPEENKGITISTGTEETQSEEFNYVTVINNLAEQGFIQEAYEGFNEDEVNEETLTKLLKHNFDKQKEEEFDGFVSSLSDTTRRILEFDLNTTDKNKDLTSYLRTLLEEQTIKDLDPTNEYDQEKILRQWYKVKESYNQEEVDEKLADLKSAGLLEKEAKMVKPKLDDEAEGIAKKKEVEQKQLKEMENKVREEYSTKVLDVLKKGSLSGIELNKEEATKLYSVLTQDDIEVKIAGKPVTMSYLEALIFYNKHDPKGSIENLALAALLLTNPKKFEKEYSKKMETEVTKKFIQEHKYNNSVKTGKSPEPTKKVEESQIRWNFPTNK